MQLHYQVLVRANRVKMEEHVFLRALASFALVQMNTLGKDVKNVRMLRYNYLQGLQGNNAVDI